MSARFLQRGTLLSSDDVKRCDQYQVQKHILTSSSIEHLLEFSKYIDIRISELKDINRRRKEERISEFNALKEKDGDKYTQFQDELISIVGSLEKLKEYLSEEAFREFVYSSFSNEETFAGYNDAILELGLVNSLRYGLSDKKKMKCKLMISKVFKNQGNYFDFDGQNCGNDGYESRGKDCPGWDGLSRRCECGNRRVDWELYGSHVRAVAY